MMKLLTTLWGGGTEPLTAVRNAVAEGRALLVDVREPEEWDNGHLKHARLVPLSRLQETGPTSILPTDKLIYLHCQSGFRSVIAARILKRHGYDARSLRQSYHRLAQEGL